METVNVKSNGARVLSWRWISEYIIILSKLLLYHYYYYYYYYLPSWRLMLVFSILLFVIPLALFTSYMSAMVSSSFIYSVSNLKLWANIKARTYRGLGAITNIFQTLKDLCLGRYFYEAAMILRDSLLLRMRNMFYEEFWEIMIIRVTGTSEDGEEVWPVSCSQPLSILW